MLQLKPATYGPLLAPAVLEALAAMGIKDSIPQADIVKALSDPNTTSYPALAQALLSLGQEPEKPLSLQQIVSNYNLARPIPHTAADVDPDILRAAIVDTWNTIYGTNYVEAEFEQLLRP